jgi:hypothetical protein
MGTVLNTQLRDWGQSDTTGYDKFKDAALTANVKILIGEYDVPAGVTATIGGTKGWVELYDDTTTAVREDGEFVFTVVSADGTQELEAMRIHSRQAGASGQQSTPSEHVVWPLGRNWTKGGKIRWYFISAASDTLDTTDHLEAGIPVTYR